MLLSLEATTDAESYNLSLRSFAGDTVAASSMLCNSKLADIQAHAVEALRLLRGGKLVALMLPDGRLLRDLPGQLELKSALTTALRASI